MKILSRVLLITIAIIYPGTSAADRVMGFAKVDLEQGQVTGYNSGGGDIFLTSSSIATGTHSVMFEGILSHDVIGYLQAVRTGNNPGYCKVTKTQNTGGTHADVQCFEADGTFSTSPYSFDLLYLANTDAMMQSGNERLSYFYANQSGTDNYELPRYLGYNSDRGQITITRNSIGRYTAIVPGLAERGEVGANVQVVSRGSGNSVCTLGKWGESELQPQDLKIEINCFDPTSEEHRDSQFQALVVHANGLPDDFAYTNSTHSGHSVTQDLVKYYTHTSVVSGEVYRGFGDAVVLAPIGRAFGSISLITPVSLESRICQIARSDIGRADPERLLPPFKNLTVDPLCSVTRRSGGTATDAFNLLTIAPEQMYQPEAGAELRDREYLMTIEILRIQEEYRYCDRRYILNPLRTPDHMNPNFGPSSLTYDDYGDIDVEPDWLYSLKTNSRNNRFDINLHQYPVFGCFGQKIDISPALDQTHLTLNVDLQSHAVSTIDNPWLFTGFHFFGYIGETLTAQGTEGPYNAKLTFRITLEES